MKTWKIAVPVVALAVLTAASAFASSSKSMNMTNSNSSSSSNGNWTFGINGGATMPTGDFNKVAATGWNFGGQVDYWINSSWAFGGDGAYHAGGAASGVNDALVADPAFGPGSEYKWSSFQYGVHAIYQIPTQGASVFPYLQGGMGGYNLTSKIDGGLSPSSVSSNKFGFNIGAGLDFRATPTVNLGLNGTYHYVTTDPTATNWFGITGRVTFKVPTSSK